MYQTDAILKMRDEALRLLPQATRAEDFNSPYFGPDNPSLPADHPRCFFETRNNVYIISDPLETGSALRKIYNSYLAAVSK